MSDIRIREKKDTPAPSEPVTPDETARILRHFHLTGEADLRAETLPITGLVPAPLQAYRDFSHVRSEYPLCLLDRAAPPVALSLKHIIDGLIDRQAGEGDEGERFKRSLWKLEAGLRALVSNGTEGRLSDLWEQMTADLAGLQGNHEKKKSFGEHAAAARTALERDGLLLGCTASTLARLLVATLRAGRTAQTGSFREVVETLARKLSDILTVDFTHSPEAVEPHSLEAAVGTPYAEEIDFDALSDVLEDAPLGPPLPERRRARIQEALQTLIDHRPLYAPDNAPVTDLLYDDAPLTRCQDARDRMHARLKALAAFFRAYYVARLEAENRYRPDRHDRFFARYAVDSLTREEQALCPPLLVHLDGSALETVDKSLLVELLSTRLPFKILVTIDAVWDEHRALAEQTPFSGWRTRLASMATALHTAYVLQTTASHVSHLVQGLDEGLRYRGPALFCVYTGSATNAPDLHPYLRAAVALDARVFPAFVYHPEKGTTWADRFSIDANPQADRDWPVSEVASESGDGEETHVEAPFTFVDFAACDASFNAHLMPVSRSMWHPSMTPLGEYLRLDEAECEARLPYVLMTDEAGTSHRVMVTRALVQAARHIGSQWRSMQELGGINNSHALRLLEQEKRRLEEEKQQAVAEIERRHQDELDKTTGALAQEIVANIAAGLLGLPGSGPIAPAGFVPAPTPLPGADEADAKPAPPAEQPAPEAQPDEEEEVLSFDEAYIETPRCTSCNECTALNPRLFAYDEDKKAYLKDLSAGSYRDLVTAAELCPVRIIHPGKPQNPDEPGLDDLLKRAEPFL